MLIADMPLETQAKILRVLVEQRFQRLGGGPKVHVDVRVVSSTSHDLQKEISAGRLREDLYHRLNVVPIRVPGLPERREDVPDLVRYFVQTISVASGLPPNGAFWLVGPKRAGIQSAPRHLERSPEVEALVRSAGRSVRRRSRLEPGPLTEGEVTQVVIRRHGHDASRSGLRRIRRC